MGGLRETSEGVDMSTGLPEGISQPGEERKVFMEGISKQREQHEPRRDELWPFRGR